MDVVTHLRVHDPAALEAAVADAGLGPGEHGPLLAVLDADVPVSEVTEVLAAWISATRAAAVRGVDVVTVLSDDHLEGDDVGRLSVGHGIIGASRSYAFEGERDDLRANVVMGPPDRALRAARWCLQERLVTGQVLLTGAPLHGRQRP